MKFITNKGAPDIPLEVLEAQENGRLIFFCGAGISYPAGLPIFSQLVSDVFDGLNEEPNELETEAIKSKAFDRALGLLETRLQGDRDDPHNYVRREIIKQLSLQDGANLKTHKALLDLSISSSNTHRIVTTNVDLGFQLADKTVAACTDNAPKLPVPKEHKWKSVVHLHGIIDQKLDPDGEHLVFTSADFGCAYLTERWASKFVTELFLNFTVVFVGYSIDDPVMRYITDAIAAEKRRGDKLYKKAYVLAESPPSKMESSKKLWLSKGAEPILYNKGGNKHPNLHNSLIAWAKHVSSGLNSKKAYLQREGRISPISKDDNSEAVIRVLDIIRERSNPKNKEITGTLARSFTQIEPVAPFGWFQVFNKYNLLEQVGNDNNLSLAHSPPKYSHAFNIITPSKITSSLWLWLIKHMNTKEFVEWVITRGGCLHPEFKRMLKWELEQNKKVTLSLKAKKFWELQLSGLTAHDDTGHLDHTTLSPPKDNFIIFNQFIDSIQPYLVFGKSYSGSFYGDEEEKFDVDYRLEVKTRLKDYDFERLEATKQYPTEYTEYLKHTNWALQKAMKLWQLSSLNDEVYDKSHWDMSSIAKHSQNRRYNSWALLIELTRDLWEATFDKNEGSAIQYIYEWNEQPNSIFKRLVFHALTVKDVLEPDLSLDFLLQDNGKWLWTSSTKLERTRLLQKLWPIVSDKSAESLLSLIINTRTLDTAHECWLLLSKLKECDRELNQEAEMLLSKITRNNPEWKFSGNESEDFSTWSTTTSGYESDIDVKKLKDLLTSSFDLALDKLTEKGTRYLAGRADCLRYLSKEEPLLIISFLTYVSKLGWNKSVWHSCLVGLADAEGIEWKDIALLILELTSEQIIEEQWSIAFWIRSSIPAHKKNGDSLHLYCLLLKKVIFSLSDLKIEISDNPVDTAINNSVGIITENLVDTISSLNLKICEGIPEGELKEIASLLLGTQSGFVYGKIILASRLNYLHAVDPDWTEKKLIPFFNYDDSTYAIHMWKSYLLNPRISADLARLLKDSLIISLENYEDFGGAKRNLIQVFILVSIEFENLFTRKAISKVLRGVGEEGLINVSNFLSNQVIQMKNEADTYWENKVKPIFNCWPKSYECRSENVSEDLVQLIMCLENKFQDAVKLVEPLLVKVEHSNMIIKAFENSPLLAKYPKEVFEILFKVLDLNSNYVHYANELIIILDQLKDAEPKLAIQPNFTKLNDFANLKIN
jgi:hypothetical protein